MTFRLPLLLGTAMIAAAGCAQQPQRADRTAAATASPAPVATAAPTQPTSAATSVHAMQSAIPPRLLVFAHDQGYRQVAIKGKDYYFCKSEDPMGSMIPVRQCISQSQLEALQVRVTEQREELERRPGEVVRKGN